jgi:hypothetical protein
MTDLAPPDVAAANHRLQSIRRIYCTVCLVLMQLIVLLGNLWFVQKYVSCNHTPMSHR